MIKGKGGTILDFMCLTMIDPTTGRFKVVELPNHDGEYIRDKDNKNEIIKDKTYNPS